MIGSARADIRVLPYLTPLLFSVAALALPAAAAAEREPPPSPYPILGIRLDAPPFVDAVQPCFPPSVTADTELRGPVEGGDYEAVSRLLAARREQKAGAAPHDLAVAAAIMRARSNDEPAKDSKLELSRLLRKSDPAVVSACIHLELARLALGAQRASHADLSASRALRAFGSEKPPPPIQRAADFFHAEALRLLGETPRVVELFTALARGTTPVAHTAALRLEDLRYLESPSSAARRRVEKRLTTLGERLARPADWAPRLAEWALADGDLEKSLAWLAKADAVEPAGATAAIAIRRADVLHLLGRTEEAHELLERTSDTGRTDSGRQLAVVRSIDLERPSNDRATRQLRRAERSSNRALSLYARQLLVEHLLAMGDAEGSMDALVRLLFEAPSQSIALSLPPLVDGVLAKLAEAQDCTGLLSNLGGRRTLLLRYARLPGPFLSLGDCYLEFGMARPALETYRGVTRSFGPDAAKPVTLRSARADFATGGAANARVTTEASLRRKSTSSLHEWRLLHAEILLKDGQPELAANALLPVIRGLAKSTLTVEDQQRALWLLAHSAIAFETSASLRQVLRTALFKQGEASQQSHRVAEAFALAADAHRVAGDDEAAALLFGQAFETLAPGPMRSRAGYWHGALTPEIDGSRSVWARVATADDSWARLARIELALSQRRVSVGRRPNAPPLTRTQALAAALP